MAQQLTTLSDLPEDFRVQFSASIWQLIPIHNSSSGRSDAFFLASKSKEYMNLMYGIHMNMYIHVWHIHTHIDRNKSSLIPQTFLSMYFLHSYAVYAPGTHVSKGSIVVSQTCTHFSMAEFVFQLGQQNTETKRPMIPH